MTSVWRKAYRHREYGLLTGEVIIMKKTIITVLCFYSALYACAQTSAMEISTSQLVGTKWERVLPEERGASHTLMFTETTDVDSTFYDLIETYSVAYNNYYITDEQPSYTLFHADYVGKERKGSYIVFYYPKCKEVDYWTVVSLTDDELLLFPKRIREKQRA